MTVGWVRGSKPNDKDKIVARRGHPTEGRAPGASFSGMAGVRDAACHPYVFEDALSARIHPRPDTKLSLKSENEVQLQIPRLRLPHWRGP